MGDIFRDMEPLIRGLDAVAFRHKVISGNLANLNTPGYIRKDVKFEEILRKKLAGSDNIKEWTETLRKIQPTVQLDKSGPYKPNGNNVHMETEQGQLTRNTILHNAYAEILSLKIRQLRQAMTQ